LFWFIGCAEEGERILMGWKILAMDVGYFHWLDFTKEAVSSFWIFVSNQQWRKISAGNLYGNSMESNYEGCITHQSAQVSSASQASRQTGVQKSGKGWYVWE
jgi:hypothetical protein